MKTFKRADLVFPLQLEPGADGLHATFAPDGALTSVEFRKDGKLREALRIDGASARFETVQHFEPSDDYQGNFEGLEEVGVKGDDFDAMEADAQAKVLAELEHYEFVKDKLEFLGRDRTPTFATNCSFCGKSNTEVKKLIAGPAVYICNECVALCSEIIASESAPR